MLNVNISETAKVSAKKSVARFLNIFIFIIAKVTPNDLALLFQGYKLEIVIYLKQCVLAQRVT